LLGDFATVCVQPYERCAIHQCGSPEDYGTVCLQSGGKRPSLLLCFAESTLWRTKLSEIFQTGLRLGDCTVDPKLGRIDGPHGTTHVSPKAMEILLCMAMKPEQLIERDELVRAGWGAVEGHEEALTRCIAELRHALGDHYDHPRYIQTVPRRGYRLVAPVIMAGENKQQTPIESSDDRHSSSFWSELKRRDVVRTSIAYAAAAWLIIEVVSVLAQIFEMPPWLPRTLVIMAVIGFPIVVALSWAFQVTASGVAIDMPVVDGIPRQDLMKGRKVDLVIIAALLIAVSILLYREFQPDDVTPAAGSTNSVAVLPFDNLSDNAEDDYLSDGLAEELLNLLAQTAGLDVTSRKASFYYKGKDVPLKSIVEALGVRNIVEGSVQRSGERIRITVQLIDARSLMHRWSETFDASKPDLINIRDTVARKVAAQLKTAITDRGEKVMARDADTDNRAYLLYLQARGELRKEYHEAELGNAEALLNRALELDPDFAKAYAGLCDTYLAQYEISGRKQDFFAKAQTACQNALALDGDLTEVYVALGNLYRESGELDAAILEFEQALEQNDETYDAILGIAMSLEAKGEFEGAEARYIQLTDIEPGYWQTYNALGDFYYVNSLYEKAAHNFRRVIVLDPANALAYNNLGAAYYMQGNYAAAVEAWEESVTIRPSNLVLSNIGLAAYYAGEYEKAAQMQQQAIAESPEDFRIWGRLGDALRQAGYHEEAAEAYANAMQYAKRAVERNPADEETLRYLSLYYSHTGNSPAAIEAIEKARKLLPDSSRVHYFASKVYLVAGDTERAILELEQALSLGYSLQVANADPDLQPIRESGKIKLLAGEQRT